MVLEQFCTISVQEWFFTEIVPQPIPAHLQCVQYDQQRRCCTPEQQNPPPTMSPSSLWRGSSAFLMERHSPELPSKCCSSSGLGPQWEMITGPVAYLQHPGLWSREKKLDTWHICEMKENVWGKHIKDPEKFKGILSTPRVCWELCFGSWGKVTQWRASLHKHRGFWSLRSFKEKDSSQCCMRRDHCLQGWHTSLTFVFVPPYTVPYRLWWEHRAVSQKHHPRPQSGPSLQGSGKAKPLKLHNYHSAALFSKVLILI